MVRLIELSLALIFYNAAAFNINTPRNVVRKLVPSKEIQDTYQCNVLSPRRNKDCFRLNSESSDESVKTQWTHDDIEWRLAPDPEMPMFEKLKIKAGAKALYAELMLKDQPVPPVLCPKGGKAELECYKDGKQIAKFGITTTRGPSAPPIDETIEELYDIKGYQVGIAAIIYMFVEPEYRGLGIGSLALEATAAIQTVQSCDFTVLVADDNGSGKLIKWYEDNGYKKAPKLQGLFGSPGGEYGLTMIRPTEVRSDIFAKCQIKWWK
jgi:GNAT superfamily N-acetyltransferase